MKTMCLPGYHHNDFVVTHVLGLMMYGTSFGQVHELPQRHCGDKQEATLFFIYIYIYGIHHWRILWSSYRKLAWVGFEPMTTEFRSGALTLSQLCTATPISSFVQCHVSFRLLPSSVATFILIEVFLKVITRV